MAERNGLHPRNKHQARYDFSYLMKVYPALGRFVVQTEEDALSIDYFNSFAVRALNKALLMAYYGISWWNIPKGYLCPPIPGRADHIHYIADLLGFPAQNNPACRCLDVGVGSNCIYPIIGCTEYGWSFVGSDINPVAIANSRKIVTCNPVLAHRVELRLQTDSRCFFKGIIAPDEYFDATICNPPFYDSAELAEHEEGMLEKRRAYQGRKALKAELNFGGNVKELCCEGGELHFLLGMIAESRVFRANCGWFTAYVSSEKFLSRLYAALKSADVAQYETILMKQGAKGSRMLAWRYS
ncbi:MAG: 23S rRNA (adenine(1618)-N(6))-methyltransferase RlmF [Bacteroides sp.]